MKATDGAAVEGIRVRDVKVESPTAMWGKMASCGRLVIGLPILAAGGLATRRKISSCPT